MKKLALILAFFLLFITGCTEQSYDILSYQEKNLEALCVINEKYTARLVKSGDKRSLVILEPRELCGIEIYYDNEGAFLVSGDMKIPVERESLEGICAMLSVFSLEEEWLCKASGKEQAVLEFRTGELYYLLTLGKNQMPKEVSIQGNGFSYKIVVKEIKASPQQMP